MKNLKTILTTILFACSLGAPSFSQIADFQYGCSDQENHDSLRLYGHWDQSIQSTGTDTVLFTLTRTDHSVYPADILYPNTALLFYSPVGDYVGTPFGNENLCISRQALLVDWIRLDFAYDHPVYSADFPAGTFSQTQFFQAWIRSNVGGFELSNMVSLTR